MADQAAARTSTTRTGRWTEDMALSAIRRATRNPKTHDGPGIAASIGLFGLGELPLLDERTGQLVAGHGRIDQLVAMHADGQDRPGGVGVDPVTGEWLVPVIRGWSSRSDGAAEAYVVASNKLTMVGGWEEATLRTVLSDLSDLDADLFDVTGFTGADLTELMTPPPSNDDDGAKGALLRLQSATVGEPDFAPTLGQVWHLNHTRVLAVANPHTDWPLWTPLLRPGAVLLPYPSPLAPLGGDPDRLVVLVQPNLYLAGWLLTKWARTTGVAPVLVES